VSEVELYDGSAGPCWAWTADKMGDPCELNNLLIPANGWQNPALNSNSVSATGADPNALSSIAQQLHQDLSPMINAKVYRK
jgi:hypothetical protein